MSNSIAVFAGKFQQGPVNKFQIITSVDDLITFYGKPTNTNYNDWYQCYNFLQYSNKLLISRAANVSGTFTEISNIVTSDDIISGITNTALLNNTTGLAIGDLIGFEGFESFYYITSIDSAISITLDRDIQDDIEAGAKLQSFRADLNGVFEATSTGSITNNFKYYKSYIPITSFEDFEMKETSIAFTEVTSKLKIIAKNPGTWSKKLEIAIAKPTDFGSNKYAFDGISLDDLFEYTPSGTEVGVIVLFDGEIKEIFTVDFDETAKDINNKSTYIENVINSQSSYIFIKENTANNADIQSYIFSSTAGTIKLVNSLDSDIQADDLISALEIFENKEEIDIDIIIANELDSGASAKELADKRKDCIAFIGANYSDVVGKKSSDAVANVIKWRTTGSLNYNNMFTVACANYKYQYDRYNDKNRWINIAGDVAGLRSYVNSDRASW